VSETGRTVDRLEPGAGRALTAIGGGEPPLAAIIHDPALRDHPELLDAVVTVLRLALENERLEAEVREQLRSVTESRARIVGAVEQERRRLERDLHDGAQQRLVAVALRLQEARSAADEANVPSELRRRLDAIAEELGLATHELREFARGIHPAILTDEGIGPAVASLARRSAIPVDVRVELKGRLPMAIESTAYFTVAEALTNAQRHAQANLATVRLSQRDGEVRIEIADDGRGGADPAGGSGLRGLADRVTALGGTFAVTSEDGQGTRIRAAIPVR
jgi:signal transduction histidine kinase